MGIEYQKWIIRLMGPNFDIQYRNRISNRVVDALSSIPEQVECSMLAIPQWQHWNTL